MNFRPWAAVLVGLPAFVIIRIPLLTITLYRIFFTVLCNVKGVVFNIASRQAVNIFALISFGRCLATLYPMQCGMWYTKSRVLLALCVTWCLSILLSTLIYMRGMFYHC